MPEQMQMTQPMQAQPGMQLGQVPEKKSKWWIWLIVILVIIGLGVGLYFWLY